MPASGQAATESGTPFVMVGLGLLLFMILGGIIAAMRRDKRRIIYSKR